MALKSPDPNDFHNMIEHKLPIIRTEEADDTEGKQQTDPPVYRHRVFIYGTLKRGQPNENRLWEKDHGHARFLGEAHTKEKWPLILGTKYNIPLLIYAAGQGNVLHGELYEIDDRMLAFMDHFEGHPIVYERDYITIIKEKNTTTEENSKNNQISELTGSVNAGSIPNKKTGETNENVTKEQNNLISTENETDNTSTVQDSACPNGKNKSGKLLPGKDLETITCYAYFLKEYKDEYLQRPLLTNYDDNHNHLKYTPGPTLKCADDILQVMKAV